MGAFSSYLEEPMPEDQGFTPTDRKALTTLEIEVKHIAINVQELSIRIAKMEDVRVSQHDLEEVWDDVDSLRTEKANRTELNTAAIADHEQRLRSAERKIMYVTGAGATILFVVELLHALGVLK